MKHSLLAHMVMILFAAIHAIGGDAPTPVGKTETAVETIPFGQMGQWLCFNRAELDRFSAERGTLDFSNKHVFEGDYAQRWQYEPGSVLTYKCDVSGRVLFNLTMLADSPDLVGKELKIEFMAGDKVFGYAPFSFYRQNWNRWEFGRDRGIKSGDFLFESADPKNVEALKGSGCWIRNTKITSIRLTAPKDTAGTIYLGFIYWGPFIQPPLPFSFDITSENATLRHKVAKPALARPTQAELQGLSVIEERVEKNVLDNAVSTGLAEVGDVNAWFKELQKKYQLLGIRRTACGMRGLNITLEWNGSCEKAGFATGAGYGEYAFSQLMYATAICYRKTPDPVTKAALLEMYYGLFDYSVYVGGMPNSWFGGEGYVESAFLMRKELHETHRLTGDLLDSWTSRFGYRRIFNARENQFQRELPGGKTQAELDLKHEDCDYMRITMPGLILYPFLMPEVEERVRDLHAFSDWFGNVVLSYAPGTYDTFKPDGSMFHHHAFLYGYAKSAAYQAARMLYMFSGTDFAVKPDRHEFLRRILLRQYYFSYGNYLPATLQGKDGFRPVSWDHPVPLSAYCMMSLAGTPGGKEKIDREFAAVYRRMLADGDNKFFTVAEQKDADSQFAAMGIQPAPKAQGHWTISYNASAIHRRPDWQLFIKGYGKYFFAREAGRKFKPGVLLGFGLCELRTPTMAVPNTGGGVSACTNIGGVGYDWMKLPGTTMVQLPLSTLKGWTDKSDLAFAGGVDSPDGNGVFALDLHGPKSCDLNNFYAKKSWFCFGDAVLCLGSGIRDSHAATDTVTTLFQNPIRGAKDSTYVNNTVGIDALPYEMETTAPSWLLDSLGTGYYVFGKQGLHVRRAKQTCRDSADEQDATGSFESAWLTHGKAPGNAAYRYVMRPMTTAGQMAAFAQQMQTKPPFEVRRQDNTAHIVHSQADNSTGYALFDIGAPLSDKELFAANKPCVVMLHRENGRIRCSVADPDLNMPYYPELNNWGYSRPSTIVLTLTGGWQVAKGEGEAVVESGKTKLTLTCRDGLTTTIDLVAKP